MLTVIQLDTDELNSTAWKTSELESATISAATIIVTWQLPALSLSVKVLDAHQYFRCLI